MITIKDCISDIEVRPQEGKGNLLAFVIITIADALCINCFLRKHGDDYILNWPGHKNAGEVKYFNDVRPAHKDSDKIVVDMVVNAYHNHMRITKGARVVNASF